MTRKEMTITQVASMGGIARAQKLSVKRRKEIALKASRAAQKARKLKLQGSFPQS